MSHDLPGPHLGISGNEGLRLGTVSGTPLGENAERETMPLCSRGHAKRYRVWRSRSWGSKTHGTTALTPWQGRNGYGEMGGPSLGRGNSISKDAGLRSLLCVEGTLPSA